MNRKGNNAVLAVILILALTLGAIAGGWGISVLRSRQIYTQKIEAGDKYLAVGDYDNAVLMYQDAIRRDGKKDQGYLKLANAYAEQGYISLAIGALETGYNKTNSERIWDMLVAYRDMPAGGGDSKDPQLNKSLLGKIEGSTYGDYVQRNEVEKVSTGASGQAIVRIKGISADLIFTPAVLVGGQIPNTAFPSEVIFDNLTGLFGATGTMSMEQFRTMEFNDVSVIEGGSTGYQLRLIYLGSTLMLPCDKDGNVSMDSACVFEPQYTGDGKIENEQGDQSGINLVGICEDAQTGYGIPEVSLSFYQGNPGTEEPIAVTESDDGGNYSVYLEEGNYTVVITKNGYVDIEKDIQVGSYSASQTEDFVLSEESDGEIRIVLEWDSPECDLDSYLVSGSNEWMKFSNRELYADGKLAAALDRDSRSGHGVETTTVYDMSGSYVFHVFDYNLSGGMQQSGATVTIYAPGESPQTVSIPSDAGNCWYVCEINAGKVTITNYMAEENSSFAPK